LRIGTCSWKYPSWAGLVYSAPDGINHVEEYARRYETVEVDQWYWSLLESSPPRLSRHVTEYRRSQRSGSRFTVKAPDALALAHYRPRAKTDPLTLNPHFLSPDLFA